MPSPSSHKQKRREMTLVHSPSAHTQPGSADGNSNRQPAWTVRREQTGSGVSLAVVDRKSGAVIALVKNGGGAKEANAHILAAAPDLLEACREVIDFVQHDGNTEHDDLVLEDVLSTVRAAIRKATAAAETGSVGTKASAEVNQKDTPA